MEETSPAYLYRFRPVSALLSGFSELESQEIYFASPEQLNDPMEGYCDIYWRGDTILWKNLLRHYIRCLDRSFSYAILGGECTDTKFSMGPFVIDEDLPTDMYRNLINKIYDRFFAYSEIQDFLDYISSINVDVGQRELGLYLRYVHSFALDAISKEYYANKLSPLDISYIPPNKVPSAFNKLKRLVGKKIFKKFLKHKPLFFEAVHRLNDAFLLEFYREVKKQENWKNRSYILLHFPDEYIKSSMQLIFSDWYTACFMKSCSNPSAWGHYGEGHRGVCLKFKTKIENGEPHITLTGRIGSFANSDGSSGPVIKPSSHRFYKVIYEKSYPRINFFAWIGRLSVSKLQTAWFSDNMLGVSEYYKLFWGDVEKWRKDYWDTFYTMIRTKLTDWEYEQEYRLIIDNNFGGYEELDTRLYKYDFQDLDGIIFGIKTSNDVKLEIIEQVEKKCKKFGIAKFNFYQAYYDEFTGKVAYANSGFSISK